MPQTCPAPFVDLAHRLADAARPVLRRHYRAGGTVSDKPDRSPLTAADGEAEVAMRELITGTYPEHGLIGEECGFHQLDAEHVWVLDPIDGTQAFVCGVPVFTTLIALTRDGAPILGVIDQPVTGERWVGAAGWPTTLNAAPVHTRPCRELARAYLCATSPAMFEKNDESRHFQRLSNQVKSVRYGTDGYGYALVASGLVDLVAEANLAPYDYFAHVPVVQGAGGVVTDWEGRPPNLALGATRVLASGDPMLHARALALLGS